jgi:DNA polymerase-3 subunit gamma/tau
VRLAYAADLPPTDKLVREVLDGSSARLAGGAAASPSHAPPQAPSLSRKGDALATQALPQREIAQAPHRAEHAEAAPRSLSELAALAATKGAQMLKVQIENHIHLVRFEAGQIEFRPSATAPRSLAGDLAQKLKEWTGTRWIVTVAREGGELTIAEQKRSAHAARIEAVSQEPLVRAVLDRFPGAEIVAVRERADESIAQSTEDS